MVEEYAISIFPSHSRILLRLITMAILFVPLHFLLLSPILATPLPLYLFPLPVFHHSYPVYAQYLAVPHRSLVGLGELVTSMERKIAKKRVIMLVGRNEKVQAVTCNSLKKTCIYTKQKSLPGNEFHITDSLGDAYRVTQARLLLVRS